MGGIYHNHRYIFLNLKSMDHIFHPIMLFPNQYLDVYKRQVIDPEHFAGSMQFKFYVDQFVREIREENGVIPGDREIAMINEHHANGIPVDEALYEQLTEIANKKELDITAYFEE